MKNRLSRLSYLSLFLHTLYISAFAIGGGYVMIPMLRERFARKLGWIDEDELSTLIALGQSGPGALIVNSTTLVGYRLLGFGGAVCAALGTALPAVIVIIIVGFFYDLIRDNVYVSAAFRGMRAGVTAIVADLVVSMAAPYLKRDKLPYACIMVAAFLAAFLLEVNVAIIIAACAVLGLLLGAVRRGREKAK